VVDAFAVTTADGSLVTDPTQRLEVEAALLAATAMRTR